MKVLLIEDDPEIVESVSLALNIRWPGSELVSTHLGRRGVELAGRDSPDIIILDLGLPDAVGFEVLREIRAFCTAPIIILTARRDETDIVKGLEWGADDYIVKPCGQLELLARINVRIRGRDAAAEPPLSYGSARFNPQTHQFVHQGKEINLTSIEGHIIQRLIRNAGRVATYSALAKDVWGEDYPGSVESLRVHVRRLREKIEADPSHPQLILTKAGTGYFMAKPE